MNKLTVEYLTKNFTEDELYDWALEKEHDRRKMFEHVIFLNKLVEDLKRQIKENEDFTNKLWKAKFIMATHPERIEEES